jgi:trehalose 6-phosphate phosphatase
MPLPSPPPTLLRDASLFLDFDGTLVPIAARPDSIEVDPRLLSLLERLQDGLDGRVTLVSGRASADVLRWLDPLQVAVVGSHGLERAGVAAQRSPALEQGVALLQAFAARHQNVLLEEKPLGAALHYRGHPEAEDECRAAAHEAARIAGLQVQPGKMVVEIKPANGDKGSAVRSLMSEDAHLGSRPIFVGDDLTDEHGFAAAKELGGAGILVGPERDTAADYHLPDVDAVHHWLQLSAEALS